MLRTAMWVIALAFVLTLPLAAQDAAPEADPNSNAAGTQSDDASPAGGDAADDADDGSPEYADDLNDFIPSSEVPPDEQVTFPVDI